MAYRISQISMILSKLEGNLRVTTRVARSLCICRSYLFGQ